MHFLFTGNLLNIDLPALMTSVFLHSLWQGAVLGVLAGLALKATQKWSSQARYNLLVLFLTAFVSCIVLTLVSQLTVPQAATGFAGGETATAGHPAPGNRPVFALIFAWFHTNSGWLFIAWSLAFGVKCVRVVQNLEAVNRLGEFGVLAVSARWKDRFDELRVCLGIKRGVVLRESPVISYPVVIGVLKPLVLVPVGFLNGLSPEQVEAVLLHELAHVRRNDYLVNIMLCILEAIFFFNPFVYWLSALLRDQREQCCDEIAVRHSGSRKVFIDALLSVQQHGAFPSYALGIHSRKSQLRRRVDRIISRQNKTVSAMEKFIVAGSSVLLLVMLASFSLLTNKATGTGQIASRGITVQRRPAVKGDAKKQRFIRAGKADSIPKNASKDFIAGYRAARQYITERSPAAGDSAKRETEQKAAGEKNITLQQPVPANPASLAIKDAKEKKQIEERIIASRKANR